ncbi:winged helix-turn-helix transcriptional regulator [Nesterenkonia flava]|uniref:Response regulator transcription factor n=1 Tax=Nesterenkonia flava TaxID=469799 RepID=A0ABU1FUL7_9MICC|nr:response regulator transcription factor [Nesterenkonia flava]MDR5712359.1 response regulator transcription factor [Nesterenkonia flava]
MDMNGVPGAQGEDAGEAPEPHAAVSLRISSPVLMLAGPSPASNELAQRLRGLDVKVLQASSGSLALEAAREDHAALFVIDARTSRRIAGLEDAAAALREEAAESAALFWFDAGASREEILTLCTPGDDHMSGTIDIEESLTRLHLLTGRLPERRDGERLVVGDLELDTSTRTVTRAGQDIDLSDTEFRLLRLLMRHARTVLPKAEILQQVWEYEFAGQANIVELYISYLRKKIEAEHPKMIHTVRGAGYVLRPAAASSESADSADSAG